ncbi:HEAT repeat containing 7A [Cichlidogyrus casuarinus]|uniref:HEAT repeat containing 7A n=1 Tax=Cichlidogyrus casuarinus TaxID=1844966 RepID=A0ABD2PVP0_9PLAT
MCCLFSPQFLATNGRSVIQFLLNSYKKADSATMLTLTQTIYFVIKATMASYVFNCQTFAENGEEAIEVDQDQDRNEQELLNEWKDLSMTVLAPELEPLMNGMFSLLTLDPMDTSKASFSDPSTMGFMFKCQNEIRLNFIELCNAFPDRVLSFALNHLKNGPEAQVATALDLTRHLVEKCDRSLGSEARSLITSTQGKLEQGIQMGFATAGPRCSGEQLPYKVRRQLMGTMLTLGNMGYLSLAGALSLVEFVVRQCALNEPGKLGADSALRLLCEDVLWLGSSTVAQMRTVLWPFVLEMLVIPECTGATGPLCDCIRNLCITATSNVNSKIAYNPDSSCLEIIPDDLKIDFDDPCTIISKSIEQVADHAWLISLLDEMRVQINSSLAYLVPEKSFLLKCYGVSLSMLDKRDVMKSHLNALVYLAKHSRVQEREAFAACFGLISVTALDSVLESLDVAFPLANSAISSTGKGEVSSGLNLRASLMSKLKGSSQKGTEIVIPPSGKTDLEPLEGTPDEVRSSIIWAYGKSVYHGTKELVSSRLESIVLQVVNPVAVTVSLAKGSSSSNQKAPESDLKLAVIGCLDLIGQALQPSKYSGGLSIERRVVIRLELMNHLTSFLKQEFLPLSLTLQPTKKSPDNLVGVSFFAIPQSLSQSSYLCRIACLVALENVMYVSLGNPGIQVEKAQTNWPFCLFLIRTKESSLIPESVSGSLTSPDSASNFKAYPECATNTAALQLTMCAVA